MIFENVSCVVIGEGTVCEIAAGNKLLWKKRQANANLIPTATATPGGTAIYNGIGYKDGYRWSSSANRETESSEGRLTGWLPILSGATYSIKGFDMSRTVGYVDGGYLIICDKDGKTTLTIISRNNENYDAATDTFVWHPDNSEQQYFRISAYQSSAEPVIVIISENPA